MREKPKTKIERLERQKNEWKEKYIAEHRKDIQLEKEIKKQNANAVLITKYKETITILEDTNQSLRQLIAKYELQIKQLKKDNCSVKKEVDRAWGYYEQLKEEMEKERRPKRIEDFNNGRYEDRWGTSFFDESLCLQFNPLNGRLIGFPLQLKLMKYLGEHYCDLMAIKQRYLDDYKTQKDNDEMNVSTYMEKKHQLGMDIWNMVKDDEDYLEILTDW